jgi:sporulation protein YlmC with PRC-barrel domain
MAAEPKIVLLDEFDVKIGSSSVIRYLIEPMYDGKVAGTELGKTAFIFSGSYLSNKELLGRLQREKSQIDLPKFMFDYYYKVAIKNGKGAQLGNEVYNLFHTCDVYRRYQEEMTPERDITIYLRQLDKFWDFLSRINGFVMEVPDISAPLDTTDPPAALLTGKFSCCPHDERSPICSRSGGVAEKLIEWLEIEATIRGIQTRQRGDLRTLSQRFTYYDTEFEPILQYKDMLLKERLHALLTMFDNERKTRREKKEPKGNTKWTSETVVVMKRSLLNYLSTAPLVHGMRSLSTLMWNLKAEEGRPRKDGQPGVDWSKEWDDQGREPYTITLGDYEKVARHVRQEGDYQDPQTLWRFLRRSNNINVDGDNDIDIILDGGGGNLRVWDEPYKQPRAIRPQDRCASTFIGKPIYNLRADEIGTVKELVIDKDGKIDAAVIDVGDFIGLPGKYVDVELSQIKTIGNQLTLNASKERLQKMKEYHLGT